MKIDLPYEDTNNRNWQKEFDYFCEIKNQNNFKTVWSIFDKGIRFDEKLPSEFDNIKTIIHSCAYNKFTIQVPLEGDTWLDLYKSANKAIVASNDTHIYIEGFVTKPVDGLHDLNDVSIKNSTNSCLYLITGS
jgi:hypothetical protein